MPQAPLFKSVSLSPELMADLRRLNPWWEGKPVPPQPSTRRHMIKWIQRRLRARLAPIVVVRGPRQIGKTTSQLQMIADLLASGIPNSHVLRVQFDDVHGLNPKTDPILRIVDWYEEHVLHKTLNEAAQSHEAVYLFFDEIQNIPRWASQLKFLIDASPAQAVVTGSSALRIELGRDSLAGRITTIDVGMLSLTEIAQFYGSEVGDPYITDNGIEQMMRLSFWRDLSRHGREVAQVRDQVFGKFSSRGGYPIAHVQRDIPWEQLAEQLNENVIRRVIQHDLRVGERGRRRDKQLLETVFRQACRYVGQAPDFATLAEEARGVLKGDVGRDRIRYYLRFLADTLLIRLIEPLEIRLKKQRSNSKIILSDHSLRASWLQEYVPLAPDDLAKEPHLTSLAGRIAESVVGMTFASIFGLDVAYVPERAPDLEVDFVLTIGTVRIPVEVKYQRKIDALRDTEGLRRFMEKAPNNAPFGLLITQTDEASIPDPRIIAMPLSTLMLLR